jgi:serine/threonine-protein kinase
MLTPSGDVKVMDFGIARALAAEGQTMTATSAVMGTAQYLSPEQARGETVDARSDLYSTGCLLYELLTGRPPFIGESPVSVAYQHVSEQPAPPSQIDPAVPEPIDAVVMKALTKDVDVRYPTAIEFRQDIERVLSGAPVTAATRVVAAPIVAEAATQQLSATAMAAPQPVEPPRKSTSPWVWVGIVAAILILGGGAIALGSSLFPSGGSQAVTVPNLRGLTVPQAQSQLEGDGLRLGRTTPEASDEPSGTILQQDPAAGESLQQGQAVDVTVSAGREEVIVPNLVGLTSSEAAGRALSDLELQLGTVTPRDSDQPEGFVLDQDPVRGTAVEKNTRVNIVVSSGLVAVPELVGLSEAQARSDISNAGLQVSIVKQSSATATPGTVLAQSPRAGDRVRRGTLVTITVAEAAPTPTPTPTPTPAPPDADVDAP